MHARYLTAAPILPKIWVQPTRVEASALEKRLSTQTVLSRRDLPSRCFFLRTANMSSEELHTLGLLEFRPEDGTIYLKDERMVACSGVPLGSCEGNLSRISGWIPRAVFCGRLATVRDTATI